MIIKNFQYEKSNGILYIYANDFKYIIAEIFDGKATKKFVDNVLFELGLIKDKYFTCKKEEEAYNNIIQKYQ